jgi:integrase
MTFQQLAEHWCANKLCHLERTTQVRYRSYLQHFSLLNEMEVESITPTKIDRWIGYVKRPEYLRNLNATRCGFEHEFSVLRSILNYYASRFNRDYRLPFLPDQNKMLKVREKSGIRKDLSVEEFKKFISTLRDLLVGTRHEVVYYIALMQYGIYGRIQDAAALYYENFYFDRMKIYVKRKVQWARAKDEVDRITDGSKANGGKEIPLNDFAKRVFQEWVMKSGVRSGLLFHYRGEIVTYRQIAHRYDQALKMAGFPFKGTHLIRHASLSEHYATCKDILATAKVAGHSDLRATERYAKARDEQVVETQRQMDKKLQGIMS